MPQNRMLYTSGEPLGESLGDAIPRLSAAFYLLAAR
jgi:hypothetical protein